MTREEIANVYRPIAARTPGHVRGDFLTAFAEAVMRADFENFFILEPAAEALIRKYDLKPAREDARPTVATYPEHKPNSDQMHE